MNVKRLESILKDVQSKKISIQDAFFKLKSLPYRDLGIAKIDGHRHLRKGFPEAIFCEGKTIPQVVRIAGGMLEDDGSLIATRAGIRVYNAVKKAIPDAIYQKEARIITVRRTPGKVNGKRNILIVTAGTSDIPVAEEARVTAEFLDNKVETLYDVGVAGVHRLLIDHLDDLFKARVLIVIAGMEGALPSIVAGIASSPVIAVPTSVGYGANFKGLSALLSMMNSCAPGMAVVNIDNGFGAACLASMINHM